MEVGAMAAALIGLPWRSSSAAAMDGSEVIHGIGEKSPPTSALLSRNGETITTPLTPTPYSVCKA